LKPSDTGEQRTGAPKAPRTIASGDASIALDGADSLSRGAATLLRPPALQTAPAPAIGDRAPALALVAAQSGRPRVVAFLRHAGCPFAEATFRCMRERAGDAPDLDWIAVSQASTTGTQRWCERVGGPGSVQLVSDEQRAAYAAWGLERSALSHFLGARSLAAVLREARRGIRNTRAEGTRWQAAGTFAVDAQGVVRWRHLPEHAGELPDLELALASLAVD
jgi:peroxiredoxin